MFSIMNKTVVQISLCIIRDLDKTSFRALSEEQPVYGIQVWQYIFANPIMQQWKKRRISKSLPNFQLWYETAIKIECKAKNSVVGQKTPFPKQYVIKIINIIRPVI